MLFVLLFFSTLLIAQPGYLISAGGMANDEAYDIVTTSSGEVFTCGYFNNTATFGTISKTSTGSADLFIAHQDAAGFYDWVFTAGGPFFDRAYSISLDQTGNAYVTGVFSGTAVFGSQSLITADTTQDVFVLKLDPLGNLLWVQQFGGPGNDLAFTLDTDNFGNVIVGGQFRGTSSFGAMSYTSVSNSLTGEQGYDLFLVRLNSTGNVIWSKHGFSGYDDRVTSVSFGQNSEVFVGGQFSDTLTLDAVHSFAGFNFSFLAKFSSSGSEMWFKPMIALQVTQRDIDFRNGIVLVSGEYQGQLYYNGATLSGMTSNYPNKCFLLLLDNFGSPLTTRDIGSDNFMSLQGAQFTPSGKIWACGNFRKVLSEFSVLTGNGVFNTAGFRYVYYAGFNNQLVLEEYKHLGGPGDDVVSNLAITNTGAPVLCGSYSSNFNIPADGTFLLNPTNHDSSFAGPSQPSLYCNDGNYRNYISVYANGFREVFVCRPFLTSRSTYDYFDRSGSIPCQRDSLQPEFDLTSDTLVDCGTAKIYWKLYTGQDGVIGPAYNYLWSDNSTNDTLAIASTGWYSCQLTTADGWRSYRDSVYVEIIPFPPVPTAACINAQIFAAIPVVNCEEKVMYLANTQAFIYCNNNPPGYTVTWQTPFGNFTNDTIQLGVAGVYTCVIAAPGGLCPKQTCFEVIIYDTASTTCIPQNYYPMLVFEDPAIEAIDTVRFCPDEYFVMRLVDSVSWMNGLPQPMLPAFVSWSMNGPVVFSDSGAVYTFMIHRNFFKGTGTGNASVTADIINPTGGANLFSITRDFYVILDLPPPPDASISGPTSICPGDTITLIVQPSRPYTFNNAGVVQSNANADTIRVNMPGTYIAEYIRTDSVTGCSKEYTAIFVLPLTAVPEITAFPASGLICPGDSVLLVADSGFSYIWFGPSGTPLSTNDSLWTSTPGLYYYTFENTEGCLLSSAPFEVFGYSTPFITASPAPVLCKDDSVQLEIFTNAGSLISWAPPLSGSSLLQTVTQPGTYMCQVISCGITTSLSINVIQAPDNYEIQIQGNDTICPGDVVLLVGPQGMNAYSWMPGGQTTAQLPVNSAGIFILNMLDSYGCPSVDSIRIDTLTRPPGPITLDDTVCSGDVAVLSANAPTAVYWFQQATSSVPLDSGLMFTTGIILNNQVFYAATFDGSCYSPFTPANVLVDPVSLLPLITGDTVLCNGDVLVLSTSLINGASYQWTLPGSTANTLQITVPDCDSADAGVYAVQLSNFRCTGPVAMVNVTILNNPVFHVNASNSYVCQGDSIILVVDSQAISPNWVNGFSFDSVLYVTSPGYYFYSALDTNGCLGYSDTLQTSTAPLTLMPQVNVVQPDCWYDTVIANLSYVNPDYSYTWNLGPAISIQDTLLNYSLSNDFYTGQIELIVADSFGCSASYFFNINPEQKPLSQIVGNANICEGDSSFLYVDPNQFSTMYWILPSGQQIIADSLLFPGVAAVDTGLYYSVGTTAEGCVDTLKREMVIYLYPEASAGADKIACIGEEVSFSIDVPGTSFYQWSNGTFGPTVYLNESDTVSVTVTYGPGCKFRDTVSVRFIDCSYSIPNVFSPNGDGVNDDFYINYPSARFGVLNIYNRWGELIRLITGQEPKWNGKNQEEVPVPEGTYFFVAGYKDYLDKPVEMKGNITLIR
ncbi:MAG: gliding motility-associated C-terminal domain-containing protein [Bacteroidetes bacterium]|nr:gliding motility-associated C-terminal domain-containing protein [Bacteroidota bacterium]